MYIWNEVIEGTCSRSFVYTYAQKYSSLCYLVDKKKQKQKQQQKKNNDIQTEIKAACSNKAIVTVWEYLPNGVWKFFANWLSLNNVVDVVDVNTLLEKFTGVKEEMVSCI